MSIKKSLSTFLPFTKPQISEEAINSVVSCLRSGWITTGPQVQKFEAMLCEYFDNRSVATVSSATMGLLLTMKALDFEPNSEVVTTPFTFVSTIHTIVQNNLKPIFVDIDSNTYNIDAELIESKITNRTKAIIPTHFAGLPADLSNIYRIAEKYNLRVIEDAAHSISSKYQEKRIGGFGDIQVFSFQATKNMTTCEGGVVVSDDTNLIEKIKILRFHGISKEAWKRFSKEGTVHYEVSNLGYKANLTDIQASLGIHQLTDLEYYTMLRTNLAHRYTDAMKDWEMITLPNSGNENVKHAWHLFAPLINTNKVQKTRDEIIEELKKRNVGCGLHYRPVHLFDYYRKFGFKEGDFSNTENISSRILSLPLFPSLDFEIQDKVIEIFKDVLCHSS